MAREIYLIPILLGVPGHKGGRPSYARLKKDVLLHLRRDKRVACTTMLDYYGLGSGFPGTPVPSHLTSTEKARRIEHAIQVDLFDQVPDLRPDLRFVPYIQLHEYEGLLFSDPAAFAAAINQPQLTPALQRVRDAFQTPEDIDDNPATAPSRRVVQAWPWYRRDGPRMNADERESTATIAESRFRV